MPRIRSIKPEFFTDADVGELPPLHRLLFAGLWCHQDKEGRCEDKPKELKVKILPYDDVDADSMFWDLHERGFIIRYEAGGRRFIATVKFPEHQRPHRDEKPSEIPPPEKGKELSRKASRSVPARPQEDSPITSAKTPEAETEAETVSGGGGRLAQKPARPSPHQELVSLLCADFLELRQEKYPFQGEKDGSALAALLKLTTAEEIRARWRFALQRVDWKQCNTIAQLRSKWTDITAPEAPVRRAFG